jgi:nitrite reductase (NADH) small subunit/3-phenylpropionate/trans-cinnamate dioxygenase ferredoxin subunit
MADFVKVARVEEIPPGQGKSIEVGGIEIALFNINGTFFAIHNTCIHQGGPLGDGELDGSVVACPWHGWKFDVCNGNSLTLPDAKVSCFQVKVEGGDLLVLPEPVKS